MLASERVDDRVMRWLADTSHGPLRPALQVAASAADLLLPWAVVSVRWLASGRPECRRATVHGWQAIAVAALLENAVVKPTVGRGRPDPSQLPSAQRRRSSPATSTFPSGHAGAATAFAVATSREAPRWRPALAGVAAVTTYSLVYTGRHFPSDAVVGMLTGAAAGAVVRRLHRRPGS